ncbi:MAG: hypothetical protein GX636_08390 [Actinomycetales bacterium]|nr:hypothetical protein [Actinomycetales bacterium]
MTNTHRKHTARTSAKIATVGAFAVGAAIALPGFAAAQDAPAPTGSTESGSLDSGSLEGLPVDSASLEELPLDAASLEGTLGTDLAVDLGSLNVSLVLDASTPNPGSVELGSLGISPNTGSAVIDGEGGSVTGSLSDSVSESVSGSATESIEGVVPGSSVENSALDTVTGIVEGSVSGEDTTDPAETPEADADDSGSVDTGSLAGLSSEGPAALTGSIG